MTEYLELLLVVAIAVSVTSLLITGVVHLAVRLASREPRGLPTAAPGPRKRTDDLEQPLANEGSSASRKEVET
jgi:hypothetical protein